MSGLLKMAMSADEKCPFWVLQQSHTVSVLVDPAQLPLLRSERLDILLNHFPLNPIVIVRVSLIIRDIAIMEGEGVDGGCGSGIGWRVRESATEFVLEGLAIFLSS